jgi:uncharacterized protein involved in outer membrane biogenesis
MKNLQKSLTFGLLLFTSVTFAQKSGEQPYLVKTYKAADISNVEVSTSGGSISVAGQTADEARVEVYIHANNWKGNELNKAEIEERLKNYTITISKEGNKLVAKAERKNKNWNDWKNGLSVAFKVFAPEKASTDLNTSGGSINLKKMTGNHHVNTSGGSITLRDLSGKMKGGTSGGSINIDNCHNQIDLETSGGSITANDSDGDIHLETSGGSLNFRNLQGTIHGSTSGGSVRADNIKGEFITSTSGGSIHLKGIAATLDASTSGGGIDAEIISLGKYVKLSTSAGGINVQMPLDKGIDLDLDANRVHVPLTKFDGNVEKDRVKGKLNGGGILVKMEASSGNITIN